MIYDSPRSYQPEINSPVGLIALSNAIIRRGAKVGNEIYTIPSLVERDVINIPSNEVHYNATVSIYTKQSTVDTAWASADKGYTTLIVASELFENDFQYQTNLRVGEARQMILHKSVHIFLNSNGEFLPPRKVDIVHPASTNWLGIAQPYDVVVLDSSIDLNFESPPGLISVWVATGQDSVSSVRTPNVNPRLANVQAFEQKRQSVAQRLLN